RNETIFQLFRTADVNRGWDHVVARLAHVDVIVWMYKLTRADCSARNLRAAIGDPFVRFGVCAGARAGLEDIEWKMFVEFPIDDFLRCLHDQCAPFGVE